MSQVMEHVQQLAGAIGPRPAATDAEAHAADYIEDVFRSRGLEVERQEFSAPRTYSWAHVVYAALSISAAAVSLWWGVPALVLAIAAAVLVWLDLDTRFSLARFMGTGPTQNIIARHVPRQRRGDRLRKVVIVAHYDTARTSLAYSPGLVRNLALLIALTRWMPVVIAAVIAIGALPFAEAWRPWTGYAALASAAYMLVPLIAGVHRELLGRPVDGANDNASGVAAMFGVMEATVPEAEEAPRRERPLRRDAEAAFEADVVPDDAVLEYRSVTGPAPEPQAPFDGFGDVDWETGVLPAVGSGGPACQPVGAADAPAADWAADDDAPLWSEPPATPARASRYADRAPLAPVPARWDGKPSVALDDDELPEGQERFSFDDEGEPAQAPAEERHAHGISSWLGLGRGFDVRKAGKKIGSWENIEDDDEFGFKAGTAGEEFSDDGLSDVAARIRKRVTENVDRALAEKEIWFVATGADEAGMWGMRALLDTYAEDLADAFIINIDQVGAGTVAYVTEEGMVRRYRADRRLVTQAKRTVRENDLAVKGRSQRGLPTAATPALARRFKALTVTAFDINGRVPDLHMHTDTADNVSERTIEQAVSFVTALVRDL